jgi:hypothetical protein
MIYGDNVPKNCKRSIIRNIAIGALGAQTRTVSFSKPALRVGRTSLLVGIQKPTMANCETIDFVSKVT